MLEVKVFEVRDSMTFLSVLATRMRSLDPVESYHLRRNGYMDGQTVIVTRLNDGRSANDAYEWPGGTRTMREAHLYIETNFSNLTSGDVIDIEYLNHETAVPKASERFMGYRQ